MEKPLVFRSEGAQPYDDRMLSWQITERTVLLWTLSGRVKGVAFTASPEQLARLALYREGESDLLTKSAVVTTLQEALRERRAIPHRRPHRSPHDPGSPAPGGPAGARACPSTTLPRPRASRR